MDDKDQMAAARARLSASPLDYVHQEQIPGLRCTAIQTYLSPTSAPDRTSGGTIHVAGIGVPRHSSRLIVSKSGTQSPTASHILLFPHFNTLVENDEHLRHCFLASGLLGSHILLPPSSLAWTFDVQDNVWRHWAEAHLRHHGGRRRRFAVGDDRFSSVSLETLATPAVRNPANSSLDSSIWLQTYAPDVSRGQSEATY